MKSRLKQQIFAISLLVCTAISPANALQTHSLREQFQNPSDEAKPWTFWYWMFGAVSKEGITADLEAMKHAGPVSYTHIDVYKRQEVGIGNKSVFVRINKDSRFSLRTFYN